MSRLMTAKSETPDADQNVPGESYIQKSQSHVFGSAARERIKDLNQQVVSKKSFSRVSVCVDVDRYVYRPRPNTPVNLLSVEQTSPDHLL